MKLDFVLLHDHLSEVPRLAKWAEDIGYDSVWSIEASHDVFLPLALAAEHTNRVALGTAIAVAFPRSPTVVAYTAWDVAAQSNGRFILGLGTQIKPHIERRFGVTWDSPAPRLREYILALRAIWDCWQNGTPLNFRGEYYNLTLMTPFFSPKPIANPRIPIYVAGVNPAMCKLAGELGDGFHVHPLHSAKYLREVIRPGIEAGAAKSGRSIHDIKLCAPVFTVTEDAHREKVREQVSFYGSTRNYRPVLDIHGWQETGEKLSFLSKRGRWADMAREITDEMVETVAVVAKPSELPEKLLERYEGLLDNMHLYLPNAFEPMKNEPLFRSLIEAFHAKRSPA